MSEFDNFSQFKETDIRPEKFDGEHKKVVKKEKKKQGFGTKKKKRVC